MQKHTKAVEPTVPIAETMWSMDPQSIEAVTNTYRAWVNQANRMQGETMRFVQERFTKELEAAAQLARCKNPIEAFAVQADFAQRMAADYLEESQKLVELTGEIVREISSGPKIPSHHS